MATSLMEMLHEARKNVRELAVQEAAKNLAGRDVLLVDVREASEFDRGHIPGAVNIPRGVLEIKADPGFRGQIRSWLGSGTRVSFSTACGPRAPARSWQRKRCWRWATAMSPPLREGC
jgi:Rhodanese-like domain